MQRHTGESGAALILLLGITGALAILAAISVMVLTNQQGATAKDRSHKTSTYYAEAALDSAVNAAKGKTDVATANFLTSEEMAVNYDAACPDGPDVIYRVYDNQTPVNTAITATRASRETHGPRRQGVDRSHDFLLGQGDPPASPGGPDHGTVVQALPKAALFSDANINSNGSSDVYAVNDDFTAYVPDPPGNYPTKVMAGGNVTGTGAPISRRRAAASSRSVSKRTAP